MGLRLDKVVADRVAHEIADRAEMQLSHDVRAVGLDSLDADPERRRRPFVTLPLSDELNNLAFAGRQTDWREFVLRAVSTSDVIVQHEFCDG